MRLWQWGLDVRAVTYATLITLRWLQVEGFLHSEECFSSSSSKECSTSNKNSNFSNKNDHDIQNESSCEKVINTTDENQNDSKNNFDNINDNKIKENIEEKNRSKNLKKKMNEKVKKSVQIGRNGNDYFNRHSQWMSNARKICSKISESTESFSDEFLGAIDGKEN